MTIRVILADDHPIYREGLVRTLEETGEFVVVGTGGTLGELELPQRGAAEPAPPPHPPVGSGERIAVPGTPRDSELRRDVDGEVVGGHFRR